MTTHTDRLRIIADEIMALPDSFRLGVALARLVDAEMKIARLRAALEHYANAENWTILVTDEANVYLPNQHGYTRAQQALEEGVQ